MRKRGSRTGWWRTLAIPLVFVALVLVVVRMALPFAIRDYINRQLGGIEDYAGRVQAIRLDLWRGAYQMIDLRLVKTNASVPVPFLTVPVMDLSIEWPQLLRGAVVGEIRMTRPQLNFVNGPTDEQRQTGVARGWTETLDSLFPFQINRFEVIDGVIRYADPGSEPPVAIFLTNLFAVATNLTNVRDESHELPSGVIARGRTTGQGELALSLVLNPLAETPTFRLHAGITGMDLTALNDFIQMYIGATPADGTFWVFANIAAAEGKYQGFVKPFLLDVAMLDLEQVREQNIFQTLWESLVAGIVEVFKNQPHDQIATRIPVEGVFEEGPDVDLWTTIGGLLRNAFLEALAPGVPRPVRFPGDGTEAGSGGPELDSG